MGMYTEFHFNSALKEDVPDSVIELLWAMLGERVSKTVLDKYKPTHPLFKTDRWWSMLRSDSYYFHADTHSTLRYDKIANQYFLCIRCNLKNYDNEIAKFLDWIMPYIDKEPGSFLGFYRYEEFNEPQLIYAGEVFGPR